MKFSFYNLHFILSDPNNINELGDQPIHSAVLGKHLQILRLLIDFGAKVDMKNQQGAQPIHLAGEGNFLEGLEVSHLFYLSPDF
ncbi:unnamed protein product [Trichobilharzia regenti]|nr:unnamed protein product [Trichobilharzia regenti]